VERSAEIELEGVPEEDRILHGQRPIEAELTPHTFHFADGRVGREEKRDGIAGEAHDHEDHGGDEPQSDEGAKEPLGEERKHSAH
jgi:hypothetical protein